MKAGFTFPSHEHVKLEALGISSGPFKEQQGDYAMDEYQEELLEYQAFELDQPEPAEDATEL